MATDMTGTEMLVETGTGVGTETEAESGNAATGTEAIAGKEGRVVETRIGLGGRDKVQQGLVSKVFLRGRASCFCTATAGSAIMQG